MSSTLTQAQFSMQLSYMASHVSSWAGSCLTLPETYDEPMRPSSFERFLEEMRSRLDSLEAQCRNSPPKKDRAGQ